MRPTAAELAYVVILALAIFCYSIGVQGSFLFDDISNIVNVPALHLQELTLSGLKEAAFSGHSSTLQRPVSVLTFALNYYFIGQLDPYWFKWTNIFIHILNSVLVFFLVEQIARVYVSYNNIPDFKINAKKLALIVAGIWALHPLHVSTVLYVVQRMTLMSATFSLVTMILYIKARIALIQGSGKYLGYMAALALTIILGVLSKENAALTVLYIFALEWFLFRFSTHTKILEKRFLFVVFGLGLVLPAVLVLLYSVIFPGWILDGYSTREFTLYERLMTEARIIWHYVQWILLPDISSYVMHHDDIRLSQGLLSPPSTLLAILGLCLITATSFFCWKKLGLIAFGVIFFLFGHVMESTFIALELVFEHRNYLPSLGLILAVCVAAFWFLQLIPDEFRSFSTALIAGGMIVVLAFSTYVRSDKWSDPLYSSALDVENHPDSARSHHTFAVNLMTHTDPVGNYERINYSFLRASELDPSGIGGLYGKILLDISNKKIVDSALIGELESRLLVAPFRAETVHFLNDLIIQCEVNDCSPYFSDSDLRRLLTAARNNANNMQNRPGDFILLWVRYLITHEGNIEDAHKLLKDALAVDPDNPAINSYLLEIYALGKSAEERQQLLDMVSASEFGSRHPSFVQRLKSRIAPE